MSHNSSSSRSTSLSDHYLVLLSGALIGYAIIGKGFAYLGFPPIYIGEICFFTGFVILLQTGCLIAALTTLPSLLLAATMAWVLLRTLPFIGAYGIDALRDSVVIMYGGFAFIIIALLLEDGQRINTILQYYGIFLSIFVPAIPFVFAFDRYMGEKIPNVPGSNVPLLWVGSGEVAVHLAGGAVFALVGFRKIPLPWIVSAFAALVMVSAVSRGAMLAFVIPVVFAALVLGKVRELTAILVVGLVIFAAVFAIETGFNDHRGAQATPGRSLSAQQIVDNVTSIVGQGREQTENTKEWRLDWWNIIMRDTAFGPHFWTGRGFGLNLGDADGFEDGDHPDLPPLRSPHNVNMTILARAGVPGVALWGTFLAAWFSMIMQKMRIARRRKQVGWAGLFLFIGCYAMSFIVNATFDVAIEGPVQGIWFWCLIGLGTGSVMVYGGQTAPPSVSTCGPA
jgi:O-Antigen ligase